jgi:hypothetical protein
LGAERRAYVRLDSSLAATCHPAGRVREVGWPGKVRDISQTGLGLVLRHRFRPGTALVIELREGTGKAVQSLAVRVVHATSILVDGSQCWLVGCLFEAPLGEEEARALR